MAFKRRDPPLGRRVGVVQELSLDVDSALPKSPRQILQSVIIALSGPPKQKCRAHVMRRDIVCTPNRTREGERSLGVPALEVMANQLLPRGSSSLTVVFKTDVSTSCSQHKRAAADIRPTRRPDLDNLPERLLDGMTSVVFANDSQHEAYLKDELDPKVIPAMCSARGSR